MLSGAATTKLTSRLEDIELILRQRLECDGRVVLLQLTDTDRNLVETEFPRCVAHDRELLAGLDDSEQAVLASLLQRISGNAESSR
ncbi:hypothetical protein [Arthrobacter sp. UYCu712]|uniref:MarR family winged helix-turn-helix transcriptional regulator n=1 Tax=Arthrobacter sp. UYCu712 TaxID=3156340 RepID=UPI003395DDE7